MHRVRLSAFVLIAAAFLLFSHPAANNRGFNMPAVVLWAWERPEDLRFLDPARTGVAFLAATASISSNGSVAFHPRTQRLLLPSGAALLPVVRIESPLQHRSAELPALISGLRDIAALPNVRGLQIDFDARKSERDFYRTLLGSMRAQTAKPIGITALASWCIGDRWLDREPVIEAVPMFFRMGRNESREMEIEEPVCRSSIGLSTDERWPARRPEHLSRIYLFSPHAWNTADYVAALDRVQHWQ